MSQIEDMIKMVYDKIGEENIKMGHVNIIIAGKTGVGKSTLINAIFGQKVEKTGIGKPVTQKLKEITIPHYPLRLYDTVGLELSAEQQESAKNEINDLITEKQKTGDPDKFIHCVWYCINANSNRIEPEEIKLIESISSEIPVIILLTQSFGQDSEKLYKYIDSLNLPVSKIFRILACDYVVDQNYTKPAFGCEELVEFMTVILPENARKAFVNAQIASIKTKRAQAQIAIAAAVAGAFGEGFVPLPFADAAALVPTQIAMIAAITAIYGINIKKSTMSAIITSLLGSTAATLAGRAIVANLLKLIPGIGTAAGGAISGGTAAIITTALGETYIGIMELMMKGEVSEASFEDSGFINRIKDDFAGKLSHSKKSDIEKKYEISLASEDEKTVEKKTNIFSNAMNKLKSLRRKK